MGHSHLLYKVIIYIWHIHVTIIIEGLVCLAWQAGNRNNGAGIENTWAEFCSGRQ